ncbi:MAG TPA: biopolymer transporter ExbD [Candidatus Methylacidiphilales bacterium]|nr:biopolymer transporter ExbD [Candidatus Methylacidiphilales bacterium]
MSMKADAEGKAYDDINVTPMVDLYLVLLLIFIIMTTAGLQGLKVNLPKESAATNQAKKKIQSITVANDGKICLNTVPVTLAELEQRLTQQKAETPDFPVVVRGDSAAQYQGIMDVLNVCAKLGITEVALATKPLKGQ